MNSIVAAAGTPASPKEIAVLICIAGQYSAIGNHNLGFYQLITGPAMGNGYVKGSQASNTCLLRAPPPIFTLFVFGSYVTAFINDISIIRPVVSE